MAHHLFVEPGQGVGIALNCAPDKHVSHARIVRLTCSGSRPSKKAGPSKFLSVGVGQIGILGQGLSNTGGVEASSRT